MKTDTKASATCHLEDREPVTFLSAPMHVFSVLAVTLMPDKYLCLKFPRQFVILCCCCSVTGSNRLRYKAPVMISDLVRISKESGMFLDGRSYVA